ncbi:carbohydrate ABC transporter permease [Streptomyces sp. MMBL 11-3]|uniref:carbohydrate ABC transporter permease n=1 Tax=Streptomyces sp. MMBL 11-3 TaxID=3382639 RepID=UPI0039B40CF4
MTNRSLPGSAPGAAAPGAGAPGPAPSPVAGPRPGTGAEPAKNAPSGTPRGPRTGRGKPGRTSPLARGGWTPWLYLAPALVVIGGLLVYPVYQLGLISFLEYTQAQVSGGEPTTFQGFGNYAALFRDEQFWQVLLATVVFAAACVVSTLAVGCALAVLLTRVRAVPRLALMLAALGAWATPAVTGSTVWLLLFDPDFGPVNRVLGLGDHSWTYDRFSAFALVLLEVVWCSFPFVMVTVYAGIRAVPSEVLEAASLDGASQWRIWRSVLAPMLRPILVVVTIQSVIWDFKVFTQIYVMTNGGGIAGQNLVLNVYAYQKAFASSQYSLGSAIGVVMLLILLAVTLVYLRLLRKQGEEL